MIPCIDCAKPLTPSKRRKTGRCKSCSARAVAISPAKRDKARASMVARLSCPIEHAKHMTRLHVGLIEHLKDPDNLAKLRERGRTVGLLCVGKNAAWYASRAASGRKRSATVMAWCPVEYREDYHRLINVKHIKAKEARAMILDMIAADTRRYLATGQLQQAARG